MTGPELASLAFRILGVVLLLSALAQSLFQVLGAGQQGWLPWGLVGIVLTLLFAGVVALPLIFHSESLVRWFFPESDATIEISLTIRDLLACGLALIGAWLLAVNLPYVARLGVELFWNAGADRRPEIDEALYKGIAFDVLGGLLSCVAGWVLFRHAGRISGWWEQRARGGS